MRSSELRPIRHKTLSFLASDDVLAVRQQVNDCFKEGWRFFSRENAEDGKSFTITFARPM